MAEQAKQEVTSTPVEGHNTSANMPTSYLRITLPQTWLGKRDGGHNSIALLAKLEYVSRPFWRLIENSLELAQY